MERTAHYTLSDLHEAFRRLPIATGDVLFIHSNLGFFGRLEGIAQGKQICEAFYEAILQRIGPSGTLVVPTFTYSFPRKQVFDPTEVTSECGLFSAWVSQQSGAYRSQDPCYSVCAIGADAEVLTANPPENSFTPEAFFGRFHRAEGKVLNLNFDAGSTFLHYVERELQVPYRFDKTFEGWMRHQGTLATRRSTIWVRYLSDSTTEAAFEAFHTLACATGVFISQPLGRGALGMISATDSYRLVQEALPKRPWLLTRADRLGVTPTLQEEPTFRPLDYAPPE